jgi:hypothetical protein
MTVRELLARIDSRELSEWSAFYGLQPFGDEPADIRTGIIASTVANCLTTGRSFKPSDFLPEYRQPEEAQNDQDIKDAVLRMNALLGGSMR